jgi:aminoglycoside phosphotransferase
VGDPWRDYAWCIWSLEYNTGSKTYTPLLLKKLGIAFDEDKYRKYTG